MIRTAGVLLLLATVAAHAQSNSAGCDTDQRFYLLGSIVGAGEGLCYAHDPDQAAYLSFQKDHRTRESTGDTRATLAWRAFAPKTIGRSSYTAFLYGYANGAFDEADGPNEIRLGAYAELFHHHYRPNAKSDLFTSYGVSLFYLTDFDGAASGYGMQASLIPVVNSDRFGVNFVGTAGTPYLIARAELDALSVDRGGNTGYADGAEYMFLEGKLGLGYEVEGKFDASIVYLLGSDLIDGSTYDATMAKLSLPIGQSDNVKLSLKYQRSEDRVSHDISETSKLTFDFRF